MAQTDRRRKSAAQLKKTKADRLARADIARRQRRWQISQEAAANAGCPINAQITILAGDEIQTITRTVWRKLRNMMRQDGSLFIAVRAPEFTPKKRQHLHIALNLHPSNYSDVVKTLTEAVSEEVGGWGIDPNGRTMGSNYGVVASSLHGTWMLQRHLEALNSSYDALVQYAGKGSGKRKAIGQHERSQDLMKLTKKHQEDASEGLSAPLKHVRVCSAISASVMQDEPARPLAAPLSTFDSFSSEIKHA